MKEYWDIDPQLSSNAHTVMEQRYLQRRDGKPIEKPAALFRRVADTIANADKAYGTPPEAIIDLANRFYYRMASMQFLPNSPTLMNAGKENAQLSACFVLPIIDSMEGIFDALKASALVHKSGGGTGFDFSSLRPSNALVQSTGGQASGPVSFMKVFNAATEAVKQGGMRRGANMGMLRIDHPDIREFITCKQDDLDIVNFNISIGVTEAFMHALALDTTYDLVHGDKVYSTEKAADIWDLIVQSAWQNGEPGLIFLDKINATNPVAHIGRIEATNPCGEQPLLPYESCNLGSINLALMVRDEGSSSVVDYDLLGSVVQDAVHFLDNVIDINDFPLTEIKNATLATRKIGLGVMGFADLLFQLSIPYDSETAVDLAEKIMSFIQEKAKLTSEQLAHERGSFPAWFGSIYESQERPMRNATVTTIAPTGTISMIAGCSSGVEPLFALAYTKTVLDGKSLLEINPYFLAVAQEDGFYSTELIERVAVIGRVGEMQDVPPWIRKVYTTAQEIAPEAHIAIQNAFQKHIDNAVSKTINFANNATQEQVSSAYLLAYQQGCKGLTIYRDGSRDIQVYTSGTKSTSKQEIKPAVNDTPLMSPIFQRDFSARKRPDVTKGEIERFTTGCGTLYVMSSKDDIGLFEVFCETGKLGGCESQSEATGRLISYCLRLAKTPTEIEEVAANIIDQLRGIRCPACIRRPGITVTSCPDAIARTLQRQFPNYEKILKDRKAGISLHSQMPLGEPPLIEDSLDLDNPTQQTWLDPSVFQSGNRKRCPECGMELVPESGCWTCSNCGFSHCG